MRKEVSPALVVIVIVVILAVVAVFYWRSSQPKEVVQPRVTAPPMPVQ